MADKKTKLFGEEMERVDPLILSDSLIQDIANKRNITQIFYNHQIRLKEYSDLVTKIIEYKNTDGDLSEVDFIIQSPGGDPHCAFKIIKFLHNVFEKVNVIVPFWAKSAATLLALGGDTIIMNEYSDLGPLDTQLVKEMDDRPFYDQESALNVESTLERLESRSRLFYLHLFSDIYGSDEVHIMKTEMSHQIFDYVSNFYRPMLEQIDPYKIGENNRKLDIAKTYGYDLLEQYHKNVDIATRRDFLVYIVHSCPDHGYVIDYDRMHYFFDFVQKSKEIGDEYCTLLEKLSLFLLKVGLDDIIKLYQPVKQDTASDVETTDKRSQKEKIQTKSITKKTV